MSVSWVSQGHLIWHSPEYPAAESETAHWCKVIHGYYFSFLCGRLSVELWDLSKRSRWIWVELPHFYSSDNEKQQLNDILDARPLFNISVFTEATLSSTPSTGGENLFFFFFRFGPANQVTSCDIYYWIITRDYKTNTERQQDADFKKIKFTS